MTREKIEEIQFNPANYDYLDDISFAGWMWEFIRRGPEYNNKYNDINRISKKAYLYSKSGRNIFYKYELTKSSDKNKLYNELRSLEKETFVRPLVNYKTQLNRKQFLLLEVKDQDRTYVGIPNPDIRYCDFTKTKPFIHGATAVLSYIFSEDKLKRYPYKLYDRRFSVVLREYLTLYDLKNTLYLGVSIGANPNDVINEIESILNKHIKSPKRKARTDKWKIYLMTYDLRNEYQKTFPQIISIFKETYTNDKRLFDETNANKWYNRTHLLIHGQYKKYLRIVK